MKPVPKNPAYTADDKFRFVKNRQGLLSLYFKETHEDENMADFTVRVSLFSQQGELLWTLSEATGILRVQDAWIIPMEATHTNYKVGLYSLQVEISAIGGWFQCEENKPFHIVANTTPD